MWKEEFDKKFIIPRTYWSEWSEFYKNYKIDIWGKYRDCVEIKNFIEQLLEKQKQEFINGYRCLGCGKKTDTTLADWCGDCLEN